MTIFFYKLSKVLPESQFESYNMYNDEEVGVHTVQASNKIAAV
jgi:hypothetical protein